MLVAALAVTLVGFVLLVVALITSSIAFAWACIGICIVGFGLLIADVLGLRKGGRGVAATAPPAAAPVESPQQVESFEEPESAEAGEPVAIEEPAGFGETTAVVESVEVPDTTVAGEAEQDKQ